MTDFFHALQDTRILGVGEGNFLEKQTFFGFIRKSVNVQCRSPRTSPPVFLRRNRNRNIRENAENTTFFPFMDVGLSSNSFLTVSLHTRAPNWYSRLGNWLPTHTRTDNVGLEEMISSLQSGSLVSRRSSANESSSAGWRAVDAVIEERR